MNVHANTLLIKRQFFSTHYGTINHIAFSPDSKTLALCSNGWAEHLAFSPDGNTIASCSYASTVNLWNVATAQLKQVLVGHKSSVRCVAFSPDGATLASCSNDDEKNIRLWDVATGELIKVLEGHTSWVRCVAFSPDGKTLASCSRDCTVRI